jgi:hypothetical protein
LPRRFIAHELRHRDLAAPDDDLLAGMRALDEARQMRLRLVDRHFVGDTANLFD